MTSAETVHGRRTQRPAWLAGAIAALPYVGAYAPYGLAIGAFADQAGVDDVLGWSTSWLNYAGTSQLVLLQMLDNGAAPAAIVATVALVNLRLVAYSTALSPHWRTAPRWWTALACYVLVDPGYVIAQQRRHRDGPSAGAADNRWHRQYYLGAAATLWVTWLIVCAVGVAVGARAAGVIEPGVLADLMLVTMVALLAREAGPRLAAGLGFGLGIPAVLLPEGTGAPVAAAIAVAVAVAVRLDRRSR